MSSAPDKLFELGGDTCHITTWNDNEKFVASPPRDDGAFRERLQQPRDAGEGLVSGFPVLVVIAIELVQIVNVYEGDNSRP